MITYISKQETEKKIRAYNFENRIARIEKKFSKPGKKPNAMEELISLCKLHCHANY